MRTGNNSTRETRPNLFYPIFYDPSTQKLSLEPSKKSIELLPINDANEEKTWRWGRETFLEKCNTELHVREVKGKPRVFKKRRLTDSKGRKPKTVWTDSKYDASTHGIMLLQKIFETKDVFPYPKSLHAVKDVVQLLSKPDSLILDFFAGSGTTGHAVLELNKADNGNRSFILCTNNEGNIAEEVCYPRVAKVISGYGPKSEASSEGIPANLRYFRVSLTSNSPTDANRKRLTREAVSLLSIRENAFKSELDEPLLKVFSNSESRTAILLDTSALKDLLNEIELHPTVPYRVYVFSLANEDLAEELLHFGERVKSLPVPEGILNAYYRTLGEMKRRL
jgi:adenine-specific DNA-methyltransferase